MAKAIASEMATIAIRADGSVTSGIEGVVVVDGDDGGVGEAEGVVCGEMTAVVTS